MSETFRIAPYFSHTLLGLFQGRRQWSALLSPGNGCLVVLRQICQRRGKGGGGPLKKLILMWKMGKVSDMSNEPSHIIAALHWLVDQCRVRLDQGGSLAAEVGADVLQLSVTSAIIQLQSQRSQ